MLDFEFYGMFRNIHENWRYASAIADIRFALQPAM
jgi:hypothetical protein